MEYYNELFTTIKQYASSYKDLKKMILIMLYNLLLVEAKVIKLCSHEKSDTINNADDKNGIYQTTEGTGDEW